jgi:hypothetical protein
VLLLTDVTLIVPSAGRSNNPLTGTLGLKNNDCMLPMHGKPVLAWNIDNALKNGITKIIVLVNIESLSDVKNYVDLVYNRGRAVIDVVAVKTSSLGETIHEGLRLSSTGMNLVVLGDTIYTERVLNTDRNWLTYRTDYLQKTRWCRISMDAKNKISKYIDKEEDQPENRNVVSGVYFFKDKDKVTQALRKHSSQLYKALAELDFLSVHSKGVFDCGNVDNYYQTKIELLRSRAFNNLHYDPLLGTITKTSRDKNKIVNEIGWYRSLPDRLKTIAPRLVDYSLDRNPHYTLEYYGYNTLQEYYISGALEEQFWHSILNHLLLLHEEFKKFKKPVNKKQMHDMYVRKTFDRLEDAMTNKELKDILSFPELTINGEKYKGFFELKELLLTRLQKYIKGVKQFGIVHGDLCFSNILFDINSKVIKLVDPRGSFGKPGVFGDTNYDLAKLRHSISGNYDFIVSDMFHLDSDRNRFSFQTFSKNTEVPKLFDRLLSKHSKIEDIKLIEGLLFISMVPLHYESVKRQTAMYLTGVKLLNEVLK